MTMLRTINIKLDREAFRPERAHPHDAGLDLRTPTTVIIKAKEAVTIDTGVHIEIPTGYFGKLESKSGLHVKHDIVCLGGVIDSGYTGSIKVKLHNFGDEGYCFKMGDKIVQLVIQPCELPVIKMVEKFNRTDRGDNGFGSTGE